MLCEISGCDRPLNRDGLCFYHKIRTVKMSAATFKREREGHDATGGTGTREYVRRMFEKRRDQGLPDPIPENEQSARFAPAAGVKYNNKKYRTINGGL